MGFCEYKYSRADPRETVEMRMIGELILPTKQGLHSDTFLYVVGTIIANTQFFTWKKIGNTVCHSLKL